jgi:hypothetical protein
VIAVKMFGSWRIVWLATHPGAVIDGCLSVNVLHRLMPLRFRPMRPAAATAIFGLPTMRFSSKRSGKDTWMHAHNCQSAHNFYASLQAIQTA